MPSHGARAPLTPVPFDVTAEELRASMSLLAHGEGVPRDHAHAIAERLDDPSIVVTASARAAFDLFLGANDAPAGTPIFFTPTVPAMPAIARAHGLAPVAIDLDPISLAPDLDALEAALQRTHRSRGRRVLVIAHLFGARAEVTAAIRLAHAYGVVVVEDRAQAFHDPKDRGNPQADAVIHSFGVLKSASALGGGILRARDPVLRESIARTHATWPIQRSSTYGRTVALHLAARLLATRAVHAAAIRGAAKLGADVDSAALQLVCSAFRREQPSSALLEMLDRRLATFDSSSVRARIDAVLRISEVLPRGITHVGGSITEHAHWVLPVAASHPDALVHALREVGFHATRRAITLEDGAGGPARGLLGRLVYLPFAPLATGSELDSMRSLMESHVWAERRPTRVGFVGSIQEIGLRAGP
jgi:hypothetical protein